MFLHSNIQFSQHHLLKRLLFLHYMFLAPLPKVRLPRINRFTSGLNPVLLAYGPVSMQVSHHFDYYSFIVWLEIRQHDTFCGFIQMYNSFCFVFFSHRKHATWILIEISLILWIILGSMGILTILILPIQEHWISFYLVVYSSTFFHQALIVFSVQIFPLFG